jgi:hypothetical protein
MQVFTLKYIKTDEYFRHFMPRSALESRGKICRIQQCAKVFRPGGRRRLDMTGHGIRSIKADRRRLNCGLESRLDWNFDLG